MRFEANLSMMFPEHEPAQRFQAARKAGFKACEYLRPYGHTIAEMKQWLADAELQLVLINSPLGMQGERGLGALPGRQADFREAIDLALEYATSLGAGMMHVLAGVVPDGANRDEYEETFVANLKDVAPVAKAKGVALLLEPLNQQDNPGYLHSTTAQACRIIEATGSDNVFLQYDLYHLQIMQGNLVTNLKPLLPVVRHMQFSSVPGRHEPQYGEVNLPYVFEQIDALGYTGWMGCEYNPKAGTLDGLAGWGKPYGLG